MKYRVESITNTDVYLPTGHPARTGKAAIETVKGFAISLRMIDTPELIAGYLTVEALNIREFTQALISRTPIEL